MSDWIKNRFVITFENIDDITLAKVEGLFPSFDTDSDTNEIHLYETDRSYELHEIADVVKQAFNGKFTVDGTDTFEDYRSLSVEPKTRFDKLKSNLV